MAMDYRLSPDPRQQLEHLLEKLRLRQKEDEAEFNWQKAKVKLARRLELSIQLSLMLSAVMLIGFLGHELKFSNTTIAIIFLSAGVGLGSIHWRQKVLDGLRRNAATRDREERDLLELGLELARSCGYAVMLTQKPNRVGLNTSLPIDSTEKPFMELFLPVSEPFSLIDGSLGLEPQLSLGVSFDPETLKHLETISPSTELEPVSAQSANTVNPKKMEYRICKLKIRRSLIEDGFVVPLNDEQLRQKIGSYSFPEESKRGRSIQEVEWAVEGWNLLSLFPLEQEDNREEITTLALMQRSVTNQVQPTQADMLAAQDGP